MAHSFLVYLKTKNPVSELYLERYIKLIQYVIENPTKEKKTDRHHILPKSMFPGFKNDKWNVVKLSARQHFIAHWFLWKAFRNKQMTYAFSKMLTGNSRQKPYTLKSSRIYESLRADKALHQSKFMKELWKDEVYRQNHSNKISDKWADENYRKTQTHCINQYWNKESSIEKKSKQMKDFWSNEQNRKKRGKTYIITKTTGDMVVVENLTLFCEQCGYSRKCLTQMSLGRRNKPFKDIISITYSKI